MKQKSETECFIPVREARQLIFNHGFRGKKKKKTYTNKIYLTIYLLTGNNTVVYKIHHGLSMVWMQEMLFVNKAGLYWRARLEGLRSVR